MTNEPTLEVADPAALLGHQWVLDAYYDPAVQQLVKTQVDERAGGRPATLLLQDGQLSFSSGCNSGGGGYTVEGASLTLSVGGMTRMACQDESGRIEGTYVAALEQARRWSVSGDQLELFDGQGQKVLVYRRLL